MFHNFYRIVTTAVPMDCRMPILDGLQDSYHSFNESRSPVPGLENAIARLYNVPENRDVQYLITQLGRLVSFYKETY